MIRQTAAPLQFLREFRQQLVGIFTYRADALFELIDALLLSLDPRSSIELSSSLTFPRRFASVYDALGQGRIDHELGCELLTSAEPADAIYIAGYAVYATNSTIAPRPDLEIGLTVVTSTPPKPTRSSVISITGSVGSSLTDNRGLRLVT